MNIIGVYGLGVMGKNLATNFARHGYAVGVFNKFDYQNVTVPFVEKCESNLIVNGYDAVEKFVASLEKPRKIILMITAGKAVDSVIEELWPLLSEGDMIADCGNSYYKDTIRRENYLKAKGIHFFGVGISGGEKGALEGPSIMPGGNKKFYDECFGRILTDIAAKTPSGDPCCAYIGPDGAGHFVKMVHNGIEYGDIEIICEAYEIMKNLLHMNNAEMADVFENWNHERLNSYLIQITSLIMRRKDPETDNDLIDMILDEAGQKGTGKWTSMESLDIGVPATTIAESVYARCLSARKAERVYASKVFADRETEAFTLNKNFLTDLENAVYATKIVSYAQGFSILGTASKDYNWDLDLGEISLLWREGCIIRAAFLERIKKAYSEDAALNNLLITNEFRKDISKSLKSWRKVVSTAVAAGIYIPAISGSLSYFDGYTSAWLPANLLQAQRDFFGAHTYHRTDKPKDQSFHTKWEDD